MVAETSSRMAIDGDGVVVIELLIDRIKDASTGETATDYGGITGFSVSLDVDLPNGVELVDVREVQDFPLEFVDKPGLSFATEEGLAPVMPNETVIAKVVLRLTGDALTTYNVTFKFDFIRAAQPAGLNIPEEESSSYEFLRGDANNNGIIDIIDAMFIAQYVVGARNPDEINIVNAASVRHDGIAGDKLDILDAMFIAQYVVGARDNYFE